MAKKEKTVLLFTVGEGKKEQKLERKDFEAHMVALAGKKKLKLEKKHITNLLELAVADDEPDEEVPAEVQAFFKDEIKPAYAKAKEDYDEAEAAAKAEADKEAEAEKAFEEEEKSLVAFVDEIPDDKQEALSEFHKKFDLGAGMTQCVPREGEEVTLKDWVGAMAFGFAMESGAQWIIGDAVNALEGAGHENVVVQLADQFKRGYSTVSGYARTAKNIPAESRTGALPFTSYREIGNASFEGDEKKVKKLRENLIKTAESKGQSAQEVRAAVRVAQGKADATTGAAGLPYKYLKLNREKVSNSELVTEIPKKVEDHHTIIDLSKKAFLVVSEKDGVETQEWIEFPKGK